MANRMKTPRHIEKKEKKRDLQQVYTLNKYNFSIFIYYKEAMKMLVTHIDYTLCEYLFTLYIAK